VQASEPRGEYALVVEGATGHSDELGREPEGDE
jgi:hypothetical protein